MGYFRELPDLEYLSPLSDRTSSSEYITVKNIFKRAKIRDDIQQSLYLFDRYKIMDGERPDHIAQNLYESATLDWVVLLSAGIRNIRDEWPLSSADIYNHVEKIYGESLSDVHHYETIEVKDSLDRLILPAGKIVNNNFKSPIPSTDTEPTKSYVEYYDNNLQTMVKKYDIVVEITNYEYENIKNEKKRDIYVLKREYLQQFLNETRSLMKYKPSSQYINDKLKRADNIRVKSP